MLHKIVPVKRNLLYIYLQIGVGDGRCHNLKNGKEGSEDTEKSPAGCAGESKKNKRN